MRFLVAFLCSVAVALSTAPASAADPDWKTLGRFVGEYGCEFVVEKAGPESWLLAKKIAGHFGCGWAVDKLMRKLGIETEERSGQSTDLNSEQVTMLDDIARKWRAESACRFDIDCGTGKKCSPIITPWPPPLIDRRPNGMCLPVACRVNSDCRIFEQCAVRDNSLPGQCIAATDNNDYAHKLYNQRR
jgi:hypothetical protein